MGLEVSFLLLLHTSVVLHGLGLVVIKQMKMIYILPPWILISNILESWIFYHLCSTQLAPRCRSSLRGFRLGKHPSPWRQSSHPVALELHLGRILAPWTIATEKTVIVTPVHDCKI